MTEQDETKQNRDTPPTPRGGNSSPPEKESAKQRKQAEENKYIRTVFNAWKNEKSVTKHKSVEKHKPAIRSVMKQGYPAEEVVEAIHNYATVIGGNEYWFSDSGWILKHFLQRGLDRFVTVNEPLKKFLKREPDYEAERSPAPASEGNEPPY